MQNYHNHMFKFALCLVLILILLTGCARRPETAGTPTDTTAPQKTTAPPETTTLPTIEEPHVELTRDVIFQILDEATALLNENETITLQANKYSHRYITSNNLQETDYLSITDNVITIQNAKDSNIFSELRYVILMTNLMEEFPDSYAEDNIIEDYLMYNTYQITFYTEYAAAGYASINDFVKDHCNGQLSHTSYFSLIYDGSYSIDEEYYYYEDEMKHWVGGSIYHGFFHPNEYDKYLERKGEG